MRPWGLGLALLPLIAGLLPQALLASSDDPLEALVTWSDPTVTSDIAGGSRILRPGDRLEEGERVHLPNNTSASLLCSTDRRVDLTGKSSWHLTPKACDDGLSMDLGLFRSLTPRAGHYTQSQGTPTRRRTVRSSAEKAIMLAPRHSAVDVPRPVLTWRALHSVDQPEAEYELILKGHTSPFRLSISQLSCAPDPQRGKLQVCASPWPAPWPDLQPGKRRYWQVGFRSHLTARLLLPQDAVPMERLSTEASAELRRDMADLKEQPWSPAHRALLEGHVLTRLGMLPSAIDAYRRAAAEGQTLGLDVAGLTVTQGDLLLHMGLVHFAEAEYTQALHQASRPPASPIAQAAASAGLGRCAEQRKDFTLAMEHWVRAARLYKEAGLSVEAHQAEASAREAAEKLPRTSP